MGNNNSKQTPQAPTPRVACIAVDDIRRVAKQYPHESWLARSKLELYLEAAIDAGTYADDKAAGHELHKFIIWRMGLCSWCWTGEQPDDGEINLICEELDTREQKLRGIHARVK